MATTVDSGFRQFLKDLTPSTTESAAAASHRKSVNECLKSKFGVTGFFRSGSFGNGTSVSRFSDVDYFAVIPTEKLKQDAGKTLVEVRDALDVRFPNTGIRVDTPAVRVPFGTNGDESIEVVPADFVKTIKGGYSIYDIPGGGADWMKSSPDSHKAYVKNIDETLSGHVRPLIRFLKAWKYYRNVPISSFYLEMRVAKYAASERYIDYAIDIRQVLSIMNGDAGIPSVQDPMGVSGYIHACKTDPLEQDALSKIRTSLTRVDKARVAEKAGGMRNAFYWWNLFFDGNFPPYG